MLVLIAHICMSHLSQSDRENILGAATPEQAQSASLPILNRIQEEVSIGEYERVMEEARKEVGDLIKEVSKRQFNAMGS